MDDITFDFGDENTLEVDVADDENDTDIAIHPKKKLAIKRSTKKPTNRRQQIHRQPEQREPAPAQRPPAQRPPVFRDTSFEALGNPTKMMMHQSDDEDNQGDDVLSNAESGFMPASDDGGGMPDDEDAGGGYDEDVPSQGFASIDDEKQDLLYKFYRLDQKGVKFSKKFNMHSNIRDMRSEYNKVKRESEVNASVKFSRKMLMALVSGSEFMNNRYDPFAMNLNGWSETVMENVSDGDYDNVFERLHDKYAGRVNAPPELELMMSLAGSAVMFHMTSSMFKSIPNINDIAKQNPDLKNAMKSMAESLMKAQVGGNDDGGARPQQPNNVSNENTGGRREMKGPSVNLAGFGDMLPPPMPSTAAPRSMQNDHIQYDMPQMTPSVPESVMSDSASEMSGLSVKQVSVAVSEGGTRRGRKPKTSATRLNTIDI